jgi:hypothetical protein
LKISTSQETQELVKAFQVLVYISRDNPAFKEKLLKEDILFSISGVFNVLPSDHEVLKQAVTLLRTLAEGYPLVTHQCIVEEIHLSLLHILKQCKMCVSLLEVAIETLGKRNGKNPWLKSAQYLDPWLKSAQYLDVLMHLRAILLSTWSSSKPFSS